MEKTVEDENTSSETSVLLGEIHLLRDETFHNLHQIWQNLMATSAFQDRPALIIPDRKSSPTITFGQLDDKATALAHKIISGHILPFHPENELIIAVCVLPSVELIVSLLAIFKLGGAYVPLDPSSPPNRIVHILKEVDPALLLTTDCLMDKIKFAHLVPNLMIECYDELNDQSNLYDTSNLSRATTETTFPVKSRSQNLAAILYTSGSTGIPKGVRLTYRNICYRLSWTWRVFPYKHDEVGCFKTALTFVDSIAEIWGPLLKGVPIVVIPKPCTQNIENFVDVLESHRVTRLVLVPSLLDAVLSYIEDYKSTNPPLQQLGLWICSGEMLTLELLRRFFRFYKNRICNFYGSTEVTGDVTAITFNNFEEVEKVQLKNKVPLGYVIDNCAVYILNSLGKLAELGEVGEVFISGAHVADGYVEEQKQASSAKKCGSLFVPDTVSGWEEGSSNGEFETMYRPGDFGRIVNNMLYFEGRADSQIKVRGHRIDLEEIDATINGMEQVIKAAVICYKPREPEQEIVAFVVSSDPSNIYSNLKKKLVSFAMPRVIVVDEIPVLENGKMDRQFLLTEYANNYKDQHRDFSFQLNENELLYLNKRQQMIARALLSSVCSVLGAGQHKSLTLKDNFFFVGGNSLNAIRVITKLRDQGLWMELTDFLDADNFQQMIDKIETSSAQSDSNNFIHNTEMNTTVSHYTITKLETRDRDLVKRIVCESFVYKGDFELLVGITYQELEAWFDSIWDTFLNSNLSFIVKNTEGRIVACGMNYRATDNVPCCPSSTKAFDHLIELLESFRSSSRLFQEPDQNTLRNSVVVTDVTSLTPAENVALVLRVEKETLSVARSNGFSCVMVTNVNRLMQEICEDILGYQILNEFQANQFVASDGTRPFAHAPDSQILTNSIKYL